MSVIYLDHNSTTPMLPEVAAAMMECCAAGYANPASQHSAGRRARQRLEEAREEIARILGADLGGRTPDRLIFISGGTEANNLAIQGIGSEGGLQRELIVSSIEHPSVLGPVEKLATQGVCVRRLEVDSNGVTKVEQLPELISKTTRLVSVMLGNNETGVLQPVGQLAAICNDVAVPLHTDAAQVAGKLPVHFRELGVAAMTVAAHKFHGPLGVGALLLREDVQLEPHVFGGFQQSGLRPGTESVALAVGMEAALRVFERDQAERTERIERLRNRLEAALQAAYPALVVNGCDAPRLPGTSNVAFVRLDRQELLLALDMAGVCCSTGSACASGSSEPSPVLKAMGLSAEVVGSSLRLSLGATTTEAEIDDAISRILSVCEKMRARQSR
jgi:cysteine desulfurase